MIGAKPLGKSLKMIADDLATRVSPGSPQTASSRSRQLTIGSLLAIFLIALGVRFLHWQDSHADILESKYALTGVFLRYDREATRMLEQKSILFPSIPPESGDARLIVHPPVYSIIL